MIRMSAESNASSDVFAFEISSVQFKTSTPAMAYVVLCITIIITSVTPGL